MNKKKIKILLSQILEFHSLAQPFKCQNVNGLVFAGKKIQGPYKHFVTFSFK